MTRLSTKVVEERPECRLLVVEIALVTDLVRRPRDDEMVVMMVMSIVAVDDDDDNCANDNEDDDNEHVNSY